MPDTMSFAEGALTEPFCVSMCGVKKYPVRENTHVVIFGAGIIGMNAALYLSHKGVKNITIADINEVRLKKAEDAGFLPLHTMKTNMIEELTKRYGHAISATKGLVPDVDLWIDAAGVPSLLKEAITYGKYTGQITILAVYRKDVELCLKDVMYNSLAIIGSVMYSLSDVSEAISLINANKDIGRTMISHEIPVEQAEEAFRIADDASVSMKVIMTSQE